VRKYDPATATAPVCKLEMLALGPLENAPWNGTGSMGAAFFQRDGGDYTNEIKDDPAKKPKLDAEREGEREAVKLWIHRPDAERKAAYDDDKLPKPATLINITPEYLHGDSIKVKTILTERCARCHQPDGDAEKYPLQTYAQISKYLEVPHVETPAPGSWVRSERQLGIEKLTQSTHAHLLTFAVLFGLTGFLFAFTSYPRGVRLIVAPLVLFAQVIDVSCWWLARIPDVGPYFAYAILGTGTVVGLGLAVP